MTQEEGFFIFLAGFFLIFILFVSVVALIFHILMAIGLFKIAKREGKADLAWMAWIPIVNLFLITQLVENDVHESMRGKFTLIYGITMAGAFVLSWFIPFIGIIPNILLIYGFYFIVQRYSSNEALHMVFVIISCTITMPIQFFIFRNREPRNIEDDIVFKNE
ncbi:hypothetical protein [Virgibacillus doumboii]|uniref:hypothetical protein n=1 Tax=Virgibacillus doumboii TaxID=2697503 RepID=UPI0013DF1001|nr:hypothetical protein [Virgibacillus doumboii]